MADPSRTASVGDGLDGLKRVGLPASAHQRPAQLPRLAILIREQPDRTLVELPQALPTSASLLAIWRAVTKLGFRLKKNGARGSAGCKDVKICPRWSLPSGQATRG